MKQKFFIKNLILFIMPLLIPLVILGTFSIFLTQGYIRDDIDKSNIKMLTQTKETVELIFNELDSLSISFELNPTVVVKLKDQFEKSVYDYENLNTFDSIMNFINSPANSKPYIQSLYIYYENSNMNFVASNLGLVNLNNFIDTSWYEHFIRNTSEANTWIETRNTRLFSFEKKPTRLITIYKKLHTPGSSKADGVIVMNIKRDYIENILNGLVSYPDHSIIISGENNTIVSGTGNNLDIGEVDINKINSNPLNFFEYKSMKNSYMVSQIRSDRYPIKYISVIPKNSLYQVPIQLIYISCFLLLTSFLLGLIITYFITKRNYSNIENIISIFQSAENGAPLPELPSRVKDEYGFILQNIIKTFIEQSYLKVQLSEKKYRLKAMEMIALQSQINPHFLFNTLKTIYWKSIGLTGDQNEVSKMTEFLSNILHYSLGNPAETVTLTEEIKNTQSYIEIQKVRYKDKFRVLWQYDDEIAKYKAIKLLLQPLVENSIYHGIKEKEGESFIKIKIMQIDSNLKISIIDNGLGMDHSQLLKVREKLYEESDYSEHIGLINTYKRLKLMYGEGCSVQINSKNISVRPFIFQSLPNASAP